MNNIFILLGPTASGKSKISYHLANNFNFEIINADLFSIFKFLNIGTAKPSKEKFNTYNHFLFDKLEPNEAYNVSTYCFDVTKVLNNIFKRGKTPLIVGGSMMYVYQLLNGLNHEYNLLDGDSNLIKFIQNKYSNEQILHSIYNYDNKLNKKIDVNDSYRIEKLLERLISKEKLVQDKFIGLYNEEKYNVHIIFIDIHDRKHLKVNIKKRTQEMLNNGLINEVKLLKEKYNLSEQNQSMKAIGYKETLQYIDNKISIDQLHALITVSTQQLAKRQMTWKNKFIVDCSVIYPELDLTNVFKYISQILK